MTCGVYVIRNTANGKIYIGSSLNVEKRWIQHKSNLNNHRHHNRHLQNAWRKYGCDVFLFEILEEVESFVVTEREQFFLDLLMPDYNISRSANRPDVKMTPERREKLVARLRGRIVSPDTRRKTAETLRGLEFSDERRANISKGRRGKGIGRSVVISEEHRMKISATLTGRVNGPPSEETRRKISESHKGKTHSEETKKLIGEKGMGRAVSSETRRKLSEANKGK